MNGGGPGSGIWKSTDGGETWTRIKGGVLDGPLGRIALDVYRKRPNILYALIEGPAAGRSGRTRRRAARDEGPGAAPAGAAAGRPGGRGGRGARRAERGADRPLSLRRRRRDVAEGEQRQPAPDVLQQGARSIPTTPKSSTWAASICTRRSTAAGPWTPTSASRDPFRPPRDLGQSGQLQSRPDRQRRRPRGVVRSRRRRGMFLPNLPVGLFYHVSVDKADAVQHLRRHAGQLQLVRSEPGARLGRHRQLPLVDAAGWRRVRRAAGSGATTASSSASRRTATSSASIA